MSPALRSLYRARGVLGFRECVSGALIDRIREDFLRQFREKPEEVVYDADQRPRLKCRIYDRMKTGVEDAERLRQWHLTELKQIFYAVHRLLVGGNGPFDPGENYLALLERGGCCLQRVNVDVNCMGSRLQHPHRDMQNPRHTEIMFVNVPLTRVDAENGPLEIWPGTHLVKDSAVFSVEFRRKAGPRVQIDDGSATEMTELAGLLPSELVYANPGDVIFRDPATFHRGTPSEDAEPRPLLLMRFDRTTGRDSWLSAALRRTGIMDRLRPPDETM